MIQPSPSTALWVQSVLGIKTVRKLSRSCGGYWKLERKIWIQWCDCSIQSPVPCNTWTVPWATMWGLVTNAWLLIVIATYSPFLSAHQEPTNRSSLDLPVVDVRATRASNAREDDVKIDTDWLTTAVEDIVKKALKTDQRPKTEPGPAPAASIIRKVGTGVFVQTLPTSGQRNKTSVLNVADRWSYTPYKRRVAWNISSSSVADRMRYNPIATLAEGKLMSTTKKPRTYPEQPTVGSSSIDPLQSTAGTPTVDQQYEETSSAAPSTTGPLVVSLSTPMAIEESTTTSANSTPVRTTKTATTEMTTGPTPAPERDEKLETDLERFLSSLLQRINGSGNTDTSSLHQSLTALLAAAEKPVSTTEPNLVKEWWNKDPALHFTELSLETADDEDGEDEFIGHRPPFVDDESPPVTTERELMAPSRPSFLLLQPRPVIAYSTWPTTTPRPTTTTSTSTTTARKTQQTSTRTTTKRLRPTTIASTSTTTAWKTERTSTRTTTQRPTTPRATIIPFFEDPEIDEPLPWQQATMPPIDNEKPITKPGDTNFVAVSIWNFVDGQLTLVGQESVDPAQLVSPAPPQESQPAAGTPLPPPNIPQSILDQLLLPLLVNRPPLSPVSTTRPPPPGGVGNPTPKPSFKLPPTSSPSGPPPPLSSSYGQPPVGPSPSYTAPSALSTGYGPPQVATSSSFARPPAPLPQQPYMLPPAATAPYGSFYQEAAYSIDNPLFEDSFPPVTTRRPATTTIRSRTTTRRGAATNRPAPNRQVTKTAFKLVPEPELKPPVLGYQSLPLNANLPDFIVDILLNRPVRPSASFSPPVRLRPSAVYNPPAPAAAKPDETHDPYLLKYTQASHSKENEGNYKVIHEGGPDFVEWKLTPNSKI